MQSTSDVIGQFDAPHDIMWSQRDPSLRQSSLGKIFVKNLHQNIGNKQLHDIFSPFGNILTCKVVTDDETGNSKGFGYLHYEKAEAANAAIEKLDGTLIDGHEVRVGAFMRYNDHPGQSNWTTCYIENIPLDWDDDRLRDEFAKFGLVVSVAISNDHRIEKKVKESKMKENTNTSPDNKAKKMVNSKGVANDASAASKKNWKSEAQATASRKDTTTAIPSEDEANTEGRFGLVSFDLYEFAVKAVNELNGKEVESVDADGKVVIQELYVVNLWKNKREGELCTEFEAGKLDHTSELQDASLFGKNIDDSVADDAGTCFTKKVINEPENKIIQILQLQVQELALELMNVGTKQEKFDHNQEKLSSEVEKLGDKQEKLRDNQESFSTTLYAVLSNIVREKGSQDSQSLSFGSQYLHDTYTFIMVDPFSRAAIIAWLVFLVQIGCFSLVVSNELFTSTFTLKKEEYPKGVDLTVSIAQGLTIFLTLLVQQSLWESMSGFSKGYSNDLLNKGIKRSWWFVALLLRLIEGIFGTFVTFWFVLQSDNVLDLFKDFTAITFVSSFDNIVYALADMQIFGRRIKVAVDKCDTFSKTYLRIPPSNHAEKSTKSISFNYIRYLIYHPLFFASGLLAAMYGIWLDRVYLPQVNGRYLCQQVYVQLDDEVNPQLSYFSGSYEKLEGKDKRGWYPAYREKTNYETTDDILAPKMIVRFCENIDSWVFTSEGENSEEECLKKHALVLNENVNNQQKFDLFAVSASDWIVKDLNQDKWIPLDNIVVNCEDEGSKYVLDENLVCKSLVVDEREDPFVDARSWSNNFTILKEDSEYVTVYNHSVYINEVTNSGQERELILFLGKRWAMLSTNDLGGYIDGENLLSYFRYKFHGNWSNYTVAFFSEPVTSDTTKDTMTPVGLSWVMASPKIIGQNQQAEDNRELSSIFLCGKCNNKTNPCFYEGICLADESCHCTQNSTGSLCQVLPTKNGYCDEYFNKQEYDFDGGDCCEDTCTSSETFQCGRDASGIFYVGYDSCKIDLCTDCWRQSVQSANMIDLLVTDMSLSSSGRVLGLIEPVGKTARVYDNDGSAWVMRGSAVMTIEEPSSSMIQVMGRDDIFNSDESHTPITVTVKTDDKVHVFDWNNTLWSESDSSIFDIASTVPIQIELKNKGNSLGVLYDDNLVRLFERDHRSLPWNDISSQLNISGKYKFMSLSDDAKKIALANATCFELHNVLENSTNKSCNIQESSEIKKVVISSNGQYLGILFERGSEGEVVVFNVENNTFLKRGNALRGIPIENAKIDVSNNGTMVASYSGVNNVIEINKYQDGKWQLINRMPSKSMSLSSNQKVMATISPFTSFASIFHRNVLCGQGYSNIRLSFITDDHPNELMWEILNITTSGDISILKKGGPYEYAQATIVDDFCVDNHVINNTDLGSGGCIALRVVDLGQEGLKSPGKIGISINGTMILTKDETDGYENVYGVVGNMGCLEFVKKYHPWPQKYDPSLHMECFTAECQWNPIGSVNRSSLFYEPDTFLSMSADGLVMLIGDYRNNLVEMLTYNGGGGWTAHGTNNVIMGQDDNIRFGFSTSVSADGSIVVVGAPRSNANGYRSGQVVVFALNGTDNKWHQHGNAINGSQSRAWFGWTVSLSADGSVFAAGTWSSSRLACAAYVYEFCSIKEEWIQRGGCLGDEQFESYVQLSLSSIGTFLVLGHPSANSNKGFVRAYKYHSLSKAWIRLGNDIHGDFYGGSMHQFGWVSAISSDGSILAGAGRLSLPAKTYIFDTDENDWRQMGQNITGNYGDCTTLTTYGLSLSPDGFIWVLSYCDKVRVLTYDKTKNEWKDSVTRFPPVDYSGWYSVTASSADALTVATRGDDSTIIYHLSKKPTPNKTCNGNEFDFTIQPDRFPGDIYWFLQNQTGEVVIGGKLPNNDADQQNVFNYTLCLPYTSTSYYFYIEDEYGDGICCDWGNGHFTVRWNNETVMNETDFKSKGSICLPRSSNLVIMSLHVFGFRRQSFLLVLDSNGNNLISTNGDSNYGENVTFHQCVPSNECIKIALTNAEKVSVYFENGFNKTFIATPTKVDIFHVGDCDMPSCAQNHSFLEMYFANDYFPEQFSWELLDSKNVILASGGDYALFNSIDHYQGCIAVSQNDCATLMLYDSLDNGGAYYDITLNGNTFKSGTQGNQDLALFICGVITCQQNESLFEIFWTENQYFSWALMDSMNNTLTTGQSHNQTNKYRSCISECAFLQLYDTSDDIGAINPRVYSNGAEINIPILFLGSLDKVILGNCSVGDVCPENYSLFDMLIRTDNYPSEFSWELRDSNNTMLYSGEDYADKYTTFNHQGCIAVSQNECTTVMLYDSYGDGGTYYDITWNGIEIASDIQGHQYLDFKMGSCDVDN